MTTGLISTVDALVKELRRCNTAACYLSVLQRIDIPISEYDPYCTWNARHYTRNCIVRSADFELLLICYEQGQHTSIHDYDSEKAWSKPVLGEVVEERYLLAADGALTLVGSVVLKPGSFSFMDHNGSIHRYLNNHDGRSVTLNLYAKPLRHWKVYDERSGSSNTTTPGN